MKDFELTYRRFGTSAILIEWPQVVDDLTLQDILAFEQIISLSALPGFIETVPAFASLTIFFTSLPDPEKTIVSLKKMYVQRTNQLVEGKTWNIPVCYNEAFGEDIHLVARHNKLTIQEVINSHCEETYKVHFIGFLPGFPYLGGLPNHLHCPRKPTPRLVTQKGSVGIGGGQTGIYPINSPGGWNIIGNTPVPFFNANQNPPCFLKPGDRIKFHPIDLYEHRKITSDIDNGNYNLALEIK